MRYFNAPFEIKALNDDGTFSGHAAVYGNIDLDREVIERGAFKEMVRNDDGKVVVLWQHNTRDPIGVADVQEDAKGLSFQASLVLEDPTARKARAHMLAKSVRGMSIGYDTIKDEVRDGIRYLKELRLWEISLVTFGANPLAGVDMVKSAPTFETIREAETWLREELCFTHSAAKEFIARFKKALVRDEPTREESEAKAAEKNYLDFLNSLTEKKS
jgi:hypothetical protein